MSYNNDNSTLMAAPPLSGKTIIYTTEHRRIYKLGREHRLIIVRDNSPWKETMLIEEITEEGCISSRMQLENGSITELWSLLGDKASVFSIHRKIELLRQGASVSKKYYIGYGAHVEINSRGLEIYKGTKRGVCLPPANFYSLCDIMADVMIQMDITG